MSSTTPSSQLIFLGTYTKKGSRGIYTVRLDAASGALSAPTLVAETPDPAWLTLSPDKKFLYALAPSPSQAIGYSVTVTPERTSLTPLAIPASAHVPTAPAPAAQPPSHLAVDATGRTLLAANYRDGFVAAIPLGPDGTLSPPTLTWHSGQGTDPQRQAAPHPHSVTVSPDNRFVIVCDLGLDRIFSYALTSPNPGAGGLHSPAATLTPGLTPSVATAPGSGPRHFKFSADGRHAYANTEMGGTIEAFTYHAATGALTPLQSISSLPADFTALKSGAEIRIHTAGSSTVPTATTTASPSSLSPLAPASSRPLKSSRAVEKPRVISPSPPMGAGSSAPTKTRRTSRSSASTHLLAASLRPSIGHRCPCAFACFSTTDEPGATVGAPRASVGAHPRPAPPAPQVPRITRPSAPFVLRA